MTRVETMTTKRAVIATYVVKLTNWINWSKKVSIATYILPGFIEAIGDNKILTFK